MNSYSFYGFYVLLMPKKPIDYIYEKGYIYSIRDQENRVLYVGSTVNFNNRKYKHKTRCYNPNDKKKDYAVYQLMRSISSNFDDFIFKIEETCENITILDLKAPENKHKQLLNPIGNTHMIRPEINVHNSIDSNAYHRELMKQKDMKQKEKLNKTEKISCEICGKVITRQCIARHQRTTKCMNKLHSKTKEHPRVNCEQCGKTMRKDSLNKHNKRFHLNINPPTNNINGTTTSETIE